MRLLLALSAGALSAQTLVVDRPLLAPPAPQRIERPDGKSVADFFRVGEAGEVWMIERIRVWAMPAKGAACGKEIGDSIEKITLAGALDNPPVPGQPVCDCHALVPLATIPLGPGSSAPAVAKSGAWQFDFRNVRWSVPGGMDVLFTVRATGRGLKGCSAASAFSLAASPAGADYRLHLLNEKAVPIGPANSARQPRTIDVQVWARRTDPKP